MRPWRLRALERRRRDDMTEAEAIALVAKAIRSGIFNDLGSGSNVDLCVISEGGKKVDYKRNYELLQGKTYSRQQPVIFEKGTAREASRKDLFDPFSATFARTATVTICLYDHLPLADSMSSSP